MRRWAMGASEKLVFFSLGTGGRVESLATPGGAWSGWKSAEIQGKNFHGFIAPEDRKIIHHALEEVRAGKETPCSAARFLGKDGKFVPLVWRFAPSEHDGVVLGFAREFFPRALSPFRPFGALGRKEEEAEEASRQGSPGSPAADTPIPSLDDLLAGILGQCDLASLSLPPDSPVQAYLKQIKLSSMSVTAMIRLQTAADPPPKRGPARSRREGA